ncbi:MAG: hypothetical protein AB1726_06560 [Planctomycetota bacterium]
MARSRRLRAERKGAGRGRRGRAAALSLSLSLAAFACRGVEGPAGAPAVGEPPPAAADLGPSFAALRGALADGDEEVAGRILAGILAREPAGDDLAQAESFARILRGRAAVRALDLRLVATADPAPGWHRLALVGRQFWGEPLVLRLPPGQLLRWRRSIDPDGFAREEQTTTLVPAVAGLRLPPDAPIEIELARYPLSLGPALALRERWRLELVSGEIAAGEEVLPATAIAVAGCERTFLASFLPTAAVEPSVLAEYAARPEIHLPPLLERAVRIAPSRREEALAALLPVLEAASAPDEERMARIAPALRWLSGEDGPGVDRRAWIRYLHARAASGVPAPPALDLPGAATADPPREDLAGR